MARKKRARKNSPLYLPSAFDLFKPSKDLVLKNIEVFGALYLLPLLFWFHSWISTPAQGGHYWNRGSDANYGWPFPTAYNAAFIGFTILWFVIAVAGGTLVSIMMQKAQLDVSEEKTPTLAKCWKTVKTMGWPMFRLYLAMIAITIVGFILLVVPGFFMIRRYMFAPYVMLEKKCSVKEALEQSHKLGLANTGAVWGVLGVMLLISLLGIVPFVGSLASFIGGFLYSVAPALRYQQLKKLQ